IKNNSLKKVLLKAKNELEAREILVCTCMGIGYKQASLFLRNIYYSQNLAILDTHVLRYMDLMGLFENKCNKTITKNDYSLYEKQLMNYSNQINTTLSKLDVAIWVVMRVVRREFPWMS
ncbi:MAG: DNA lyase, partial [Nanoarchaeota archaeon]|nr:DNA lyase [Nanoarchaeota archaeon]